MPCAETMGKQKQKEAKAAAETKQQKIGDEKQKKVPLTQIKRDKEERQERAAQEKALREGEVEETRERETRAHGVKYAARKQGGSQRAK